MGRQIQVALERTIPAPPPRGLRRVHCELLDRLTQAGGAEPAG
jgi:hypothetical protein